VLVHDLPTRRDDDARRPPPTRRDATTNVRTALRALSLRLPHLFPLKNLEPVTPSRICNGWYPHRLHTPLTTLTKASTLPFQQSLIIVPFPLRLRLHKQDPISHITWPRYRPFTIGLVPYWLKFSQKRPRRRRNLCNRHIQDIGSRRLGLTLSHRYRS